MTRFARGKGSKASNERVPEDATSWTVMKQQLLEKNKEIEVNKLRCEVINQRNNSYKAFLADKEEEESKHSKWADFPGITKIDMKKNCGGKKKNIKIKKVLNNNLELMSSDDEFSQLKFEIDKVLDKSNTKENSDSDSPPDEETSRQKVATPKINKKQVKIKKLKILVDNNIKNAKQKNDTYSEKNVENIQVGKKNIKKNISKSNNKVNVEEKRTEKNLTEADLKKIEKKKKKRIRQMEKQKKKKAELKLLKEAELKTQSDQINTEDNKVNNISKRIKTIKKTPKYRDKEEHPRKKPLLPHKMSINGKVIEIEYVEGFPVKKEDAMRLKKLRKEMISKGLPRSEINIALKLERRKAEKSFAREKKKVCFNCRKSGHNLSDCPELDKNQVAATVGCGICFKCGSTEHTHFECKVVRGQNFNYAQCFICNEQGHIARQCPDNPKGVYPKGGGCKVCGDVTHLKKDCPKYQEQQQKEEDKFKIETLGSSNPDALEENGENIVKVENRTRNKIIKF